MASCNASQQLAESLPGGAGAWPTSVSNDQSEEALMATLIDGSVQLAQVPAESAVRSRLGQPGVATVDYGAGKKVLGCSAQPSGHEQRVLA